MRLNTIYGLHKRNCECETGKIWWSVLLAASDEMSNRTWGRCVSSILHLIPRDEEAVTLRDCLRESSDRVTKSRRLLRLHVRIEQAFAEWPEATALGHEWCGYLLEQLSKTASHPGPAERALRRAWMHLAIARSLRGAFSSYNFAVTARIAQSLFDFTRDPFFLIAHTYYGRTSGLLDEARSLGIAPHSEVKNPGEPLRSCEQIDVGSGDVIVIYPDHVRINRTAEIVVVVSSGGGAVDLAAEVVFDSGTQSSETNMKSLDKGSAVWSYKATEPGRRVFDVIALDGSEAEARCLSFMAHQDLEENLPLRLESLNTDVFPAGENCLRIHFSQDGYARSMLTLPGLSASIRGIAPIPPHLERDLSMFLQNQLVSLVEARDDLNARADLAAVGSMLSSLIGSDALKAVDNSLSGPEEFNILTNRLGLPWQLLDLGGDGGFSPLFERCAVSSWPEGVNCPERTVEVRTIAHICPDVNEKRRGRSLIQEESEVLSSFAKSRRIKHKKCLGTSTELFEQLEQLAPDWVQFTGHGCVEGTIDPTLSLDLGGGQNLRLAQMTDSRLAWMMSRNPFVFLNSCSSGIAGEPLVPRQTFATRFASAGAAACLVTLWPVSAKCAEEMIRLLTKQLANGCSSLSRAVARAQRELRAILPAYDPSWAAYALIAVPDVELVLGDGGPMK